MDGNQESYKYNESITGPEMSTLTPHRRYFSHSSYSRCVWFLLLVILLALDPSALARPNVVVILSDDQGWGDLSLNGNTNLKTPHLDSLAKGGALFDRFFVQPVCSPTRAEFLTGRYHPRGGVRGVSTGGERLNLDESTVADAFTAAGYATACFGKWHNGSQMPYHPNGRGFAEYYGFTSGHWGDYFGPPLDHNGKAVRGDGFLADDLTTKAVTFIADRRTKPFFCYLAFNTPHSPMQVPDPYWARYQSKELKLSGGPREDVPHTRAALAMCENLDDNVGRVLKALADAKLTDDTIVVFFHDNGPNGGRWNGGLKGRKGSTDEGGVRSPLFVRWPSGIRPGVQVQAVAGAVDLLPTLCELAGVKPAGAKPLDGISFAKPLRGEQAAAPDRVLFQHWNGKTSARSQTHRLDADGKLFDMTADPGQTTDVAAKQPEVAAKLKQAVADWRKDVLAGTAGKDDRPFPVGHRGHSATTLPARDGVPHGTVKRSANAPNCSYFTNWTKPGDGITWDVDVLTPGRYRVEVLHTCAKENAGVTVEVRLGDAKAVNTVADAHDPPATGAEHDRVPRVGESLVKDFKPWLLGELTLSKGRGTLTLTAPDIPGKQAIEVRGLVLTRVR